MICFTRSLCDSICIRIQIHTIRNIVLYTSLYIFFPSLVILRCFICTISTSNNRIINTWLFYSFPVNLFIMGTYINTFCDSFWILRPGRINRWTWKETHRMSFSSFSICISKAIRNIILFIITDIFTIGW